MRNEYIIEPKSGLHLPVTKGSTIEVIDVNGQQVVDFFATNQTNPNEYLSTGVTIDCNESLKVSTGDTIYTNLYNKMFTIVADDVKEHDLLHPCCRPEMYDFFYNNGENHSSCLTNINRSLENVFTIQRPEITPFNIFMYTKILPDGKLSVETPLSKAGDKLVLVAEMDVLLAIAACSVSESNCNGGQCDPIKLVVEEK